MRRFLLLMPLTPRTPKASLASIILISSLGMGGTTTWSRGAGRGGRGGVGRGGGGWDGAGVRARAREGVHKVNRRVAHSLQAVGECLGGCEPCIDVKQLAVLGTLEDPEVLVSLLGRALHLRRVG